MERRMTDFDTLRGYALNCAVATELGWIQDAKHKRWWDGPNGASVILLRDGESVGVAPSFDFAHNVADAWTLDGDGWCWSFYEQYQPDVLSPVALEAEMCAVGLDMAAEVTLPFAEFGSKAEVYATARCIIWLKARAAKRAASCCNLQSNEAVITGES